VTVAEKVEIEVTITPDGQVKLETHGLKGASCLAETEALEKALGKVVGRRKTSEFYQQATGAKASAKQK
jgi:uncharacterized protein GlcG (DUF336 family)